MRRLLFLLFAMVAAASDVAAQTTPFPLPRVFREDDPANITFGPFLLMPGEPNVVFLRGPIDDDAPAAFVRALRERPQATVLALVSGGGLVDPAMLVAREVRRRGLATLVPPGAVCASACAFIFLAGTERVALGQLGVHQISNDDNDLVAGQTALADEVTGHSLAGGIEIENYAVVAASARELSVLLEVTTPLSLLLSYEDRSEASYDREDDVYFGAETGELEFEDERTIRVFARLGTERPFVRDLQILTREINVSEPYETYK